MPPKPAMMAAWLEKAREGECGTVIHSHECVTVLHSHECVTVIHSAAALDNLRYEAVRSSTMLLFEK